MSGQVGDLEPELLVDGCLYGGIGGADDVTQVAEADDEGADVVFGEPAAGLAADLVGAENLRHQAIFVNHAPGAIAPLDPELIQIRDAVGQLP